MHRVTFVVGPGRSGTSTLAGALARAGHEVPGKVIGPNPTNPRGFYEPRWVVDRHKALLKRSQVGTLDSDPLALDQVRKVTSRPEIRTEIREWLEKRLEVQQAPLVVKDPRLPWFIDLWSDIAAELGASTSYLIMLRHPSEISQSRSAHYDKHETERYDRVAHVTGWLNVALLTERATRDQTRAFIEYPAFLADWRAELTRADATAQLGLGESLAADPHPIDDFITPSLRRSTQGWEGIDLPRSLAELADGTYDALASLTVDETATLPRLDRLYDDYLQLVSDARAVMRWQLRRAHRTGYRKGVAKEPEERDESAEPTQERGGPLRRLRRSARG